MNARVEDPTLWDNPEQAQAVSRERSRLEAQVSAVKDMEQGLEDGIMLADMADEEGDEATLNEAREQLKAIKDRAARAELEALLSGEADGNDAYLEVNSGAGGTESNDWAGMLLRMYSRWARSHGYEVELQEEESGEQAGIKSATLLVSGPNAYGWLKSESGVHRLVRISPYDAAAKRHTSFASIGVSPVVDDTIEIDIPNRILRTTVSDATLAARRDAMEERGERAWQPDRTRTVSVALQAYSALTTSAARGAVRDVSQLGRRTSR